MMLAISNKSAPAPVLGGVEVHEMRRVKSGFWGKVLRVRNNYIEVRDASAHKTLFISKSGLMKRVYKDVGLHLKGFNFESTNDYATARKINSEFVRKQYNVYNCVRMHIAREIDRDRYFSTLVASTKLQVPFDAVSYKITSELLSKAISCELKTYRLKKMVS